MRIGINATTQLGRSDIAGFTQHALAAEADGFSSYWLGKRLTDKLTGPYQELCLPKELRVAK